MLSGSMVAIVTPMHPDGSLDWESLRRLVAFHIEQGTDAIVSVGTTGESATLSHEEHGEVMRATVQYANGKVPVIGGTGANSTSEAIALTRSAAESGVDACLLVVPYYNKPTQEGLYRHFRSIAEAVPIPQILYNVPGRTALDMDNDTVVRLAEVPNIVGIKDATADMSRASDLVERCPDEFSIYSGDDATCMDLMLRGGRGTISVTANVAPRAMHDMATAAIAGETQRARELNAALDPLHEALFLESNPIPVKWAVEQLGLMGGGIRLPLTTLSEQYQDAVRAAMKSAGVL